MGLLSFPYPTVRPEEGYWAPVTASLNWCEEDYYATIYSAEIVNTLTNLLFIAFGIRGVRSCLKYEHDEVFLVAFIGYLAVGAGSFAFHSTLKYPMQLVDELSMIYTACLMCYATFSFSKSRAARQILGVGLASLAVFITLYYHYLQNPAFHQNTFALITTVVVCRSIYTMEFELRPVLKAKDITELQKYDGQTTVPKSIRNTTAGKHEAILKEMWVMVITGLTIFLGGFAIWSLDIKYCTNIRHWRHQIGLPFGVLLEGHGWWHLMTGTGSYFHIVWSIWLRHCLNGRQDEYILHWPSIFVLPEVIPLFVAREPKSYGESVNGHTNGRMDFPQAEKKTT